MIIIDYCSFSIDNYLLLLMIVIDSYYHDKINFNSIIIEVVRPVLNFLLFFYDKISQALKSTKNHQKALKSTKKHFFFLSIFLVDLVKPTFSS